MSTTTPGPGRPREFEAAVALDAALELFWRRGYQVTSTRDLEAHLGVSQSSLYNAFGSKAKLLDAAMDRYEVRINDRLVRPLEQAPDGLAAIDQFFAALRRWITEDGRRGCMVVNLMAEDGGDDPALTRRTRRYRRRVRTALRRALERAAASGETSPDDLDERTDLLFGIVLGLNIAVRGGASRREIDGILHAVTSATAGWRLAHR